MKTKNRMLLMYVLGCCCAIAQTNMFVELVSEMPITFEPQDGDFDFSRNVDEFSSSKVDTDKTTESKEKTSDSQKTAKTAKVESSASAGISHEMTMRTVSANAAAGLAGGAGGGMLGPLPLGGVFGGVAGARGGGVVGAAVASSKTQIELNARLSASASMEKSLLSEKEQEEIRKIKSAIRETTTREAKNWTFKVSGRFVNRTAHRYACRDVSDAKIIVEGWGLSIPLKYNGRAFEVLDGDTDKPVDFEAEIRNEDHLALLQWMKDNHRLNKRNLAVKIGADFPLYEVSEEDKTDGKKKLAFHSREESPISVDVRFHQKFRDKFPLSVKRFVQSAGHDKRELTVKEVLIAVSEYFCQKNGGEFKNREQVFTFDDTGLTHVLGRPIGKVFVDKSDSSAYKMLMMRRGREWFSRVDDKVLSRILYGVEINRNIVFDEIGDVDIAAYPKEFSDEVKKDYIDQLTKFETKKRSKRGQGALVCLYWSLGEKRKAVGHLANMGTEGFDLTMIGDDGNPLFWRIIMEGEVEDARKIVTLSRDIVDAANRQANDKGQTILSLIIANNDLEKYKILTNAGINKIKDGQSEHIFFASECGSTNIVRWLVEDAKHRTAKASERYAVVNSHDDKKWTPLMYAACNGHLDLCKFLVEQGADVNKKVDKTDVMCDDKENTYRLTRIYIKAMRDLMKCQSSWWGSPSYDVEKIHRFLEDGVDVDYRWNFRSHGQWHYSDYGWTFLRWAVDNNKADLVRELVKCGSKVSEEYHRQRNGMLPLEYAIDKYVNDKEGKEDWTIVDELMKADDVCIGGFKEIFNGLIAAERASTTIKDREKLDKLQVEKAIAGYKKEFLALAKNNELKPIKKSLPKNETIRKDWLDAALKQKETGKKVREYLYEIQ